MIRLGHALAAACFAAALMLSTVALIDQRRVAAPAPMAIARSTDDAQRLETEVRTLEQRLAATELRLGDVEQQRSPATVKPRSSAASPTARPGNAVTASARRVSPPPASEGSASLSMRERGEAMAIGPVASERVTSASDDLGTKVRGEWESVKRGVRRAGEGMRSGIADLGRRMKDTFRREAD